MKSLTVLIFCVFCIVLTTFTSIAQNLVPNPSFEVYSVCPDAVSQINRSTGWSQPTTGTSDYFNQCMLTSGNVSVPFNFLGYQVPKTGVAYAGCYVFDSIFTYREYMQNQLITSLTANDTYYVSMFVSLANKSRYAVDALGIYFSQNVISSNNFQTLIVTPQIKNLHGQVLRDTINWTKIEGYFVADGGEKYITIGNFETDANTVTALSCPSCTGSENSYYYIDDVYVEKCSQPDINAGEDRVLNCSGASVILDGFTTTPNTSYTWSGPGIVGSTTILSPTVNAVGTYTLTVTNINTGYTNKDSVIVTILKLPTADFISEPDTLHANQTVQFIDKSANAKAWYWQFSSATADTSFLQNPTKQYSNLGVFPVTLIVTSTDGCLDSLTKNIEIKQSAVAVPQAFTPNGDGVNDVLHVKGGPFKELDFKIFNQWGNQIFNSQEQTKGWDGTYNGVLQSTGVFVFTLKVITFFDEEINFSGEVTLLN
ncbi:MAG: gliding motility-associated C-terminal domain-containing protein [Bacteroidota bacterium]